MKPILIEVSGGISLNNITQYQNLDIDWQLQPNQLLVIANQLV